MPIVSDKVKILEMAGVWRWWLGAGGGGGGRACLRRWQIRRLQFWPRLNSKRWSLKSFGRRFSKAQARKQAVAALVLTRAHTQARTRAHTHTHLAYVPAKPSTGCVAKKARTLSKAA